MLLMVVAFLALLPRPAAAANVGAKEVDSPVGVWTHGATQIEIGGNGTAVLLTEFYGGWCGMPGDRYLQGLTGAGSSWTAIRVKCDGSPGPEVGLTLQGDQLIESDTGDVWTRLNTTRACRDVFMKWEQRLAEVPDEKLKKWLTEHNVDLATPVYYVTLKKNFCWDGRYVLSSSSSETHGITPNGKILNFTWGDGSPTNSGENCVEQDKQCTRHRTDFQPTFTWKAPVEIVNHEVSFTPKLSLLGYRNGSWECGGAVTGSGGVRTCWSGPVTKL